MTKPSALIKAAVETLVHDGLTLEDAQIAALIALSRISASSGPKNLKRLVNENSHLLVAGVPEPEFQLPDPWDCEEFIAVPVRYLRNAHSWLHLCDGVEERVAARDLWSCLYPEDKT